ncbi:MAG: alkaline shock response membrane anchor protein AmaP [Coriobacteriia bacterium]|nr:alkaline shock response membrane anchor protein AmaP [Coriobacteriia bacterium]
MGMFKRLGFIISGLCILVSLAFFAILLTNFNGWGLLLARFFRSEAGNIVLWTTIGLAAFSGLVFLLRGIFASGSRKHLVTQKDLGEVEISRSALESTVYKAILVEPGVEAELVDVLVSKGPDPKLSVYTHVKILPEYPGQETVKRLQASVKEALENLSGVEVEAVDVQLVSDGLEDNK